MPECPKCNENIEFLEVIVRKEHVDKATYDSTTEDLVIENDYKEEYFGNELGTVTSQKYICPKCHKPLFTNRDKAINFLKGA